MLTQWKPAPEEQASATWNMNLARFPDCSPFQAFEWGQYHKPLGWRPIHYAALTKTGEVSAMCLGLLRRLPARTGFVWCVGGPIGDIAAWDALPAAILAGENLSRLYFRVRCDRPRRAGDALFLRKKGWTPSSFVMGSSMSMELNLAADPQSLLAGFSRNWRRSLRQAQDEGLVVKRIADPDVEEIRRVYAEMEENKQLPEQFSREKLASLFRHAGEDFVFLRCEDRDGRMVAFRGAWIVGNRACDYVAAANADGRRMRASFLVLWELLRHCRERGVVHFDLGGIDPCDNPGVYHFKRQTGAAEVEFLGEWDWAQPPVLKWVGNWAIGKRQNGRAHRAQPAIGGEE